jgi:hypothetical protein
MFSVLDVLVALLCLHFDVSRGDRERKALEWAPPMRRDSQRGDWNPTFDYFWTQNSSSAPWLQWDFRSPPLPNFHRPTHKHSKRCISRGVATATALDCCNVLCPFISKTIGNGHEKLSGGNQIWDFAGGRSEFREVTLDLCHWPSLTGLEVVITCKNCRCKSEF